MPFVYFCSTFLYLEMIDQVPNSEASFKIFAGVKKSGKELNTDIKLVYVLRGAVSSTLDDDGWSNLSFLCAHVANQTIFDPRNYGRVMLSSLFDAIDSFEAR